MDLFSERKGVKPVKSVIQVNSMDSDLRNGLWNVLTIFYWDQVEGYRISYHQKLYHLMKSLWPDYFKAPLDTLPKTSTDPSIVYWPTTYDEIRGYFSNVNGMKLTTLEFVANTYEHEPINQKFMESCNDVLERELSAYRFVGGKITQITVEEEIAEIEEALEAPKALKPVSTHLRRALDLLADRKSPDYRNSIKESISAVESICSVITGNTGATLGQALKEIEDKVGLHPALKRAFSSLYGYTSDAEGIRHALLDEPKLDFEDAKFMLVACSGFINYLKSKSPKAGIKL